MQLPTSARARRRKILLNLLGHDSQLGLCLFERDAVAQARDGLPSVIVAAHHPPWWAIAKAQRLPEFRFFRPCSVLGHDADDEMRHAGQIDLRAHSLGITAKAPQPPP